MAGAACHETTQERPGRQYLSLWARGSRAGREALRLGGIRGGFRLLSADPSCRPALPSQRPIRHRDVVAQDRSLALACAAIDPVDADGQAVLAAAGRLVEYPIVVDGAGRAQARCLNDLGWAIQGAERLPIDAASGCGLRLYGQLVPAAPTNSPPPSSLRLRRLTMHDSVSMITGTSDWRVAGTTADHAALIRPSSSRRRLL